MENKKIELRIDPEFASKIPPLTDDELARLHSNILTEGRLISPIVVWNGVIVDGHNRYKFIQRNPEIEYDVYEMDFENRSQAIAWICRNQLGRRNLTSEQKKYLIGKQYEAEKQAWGGDRKSEESKYQNDTLIEDTGTRLAKENHVSRISVLRAYGYANAVDLAEESVPGIKDEILSGTIKATDAEIMLFAKTAPEQRVAYAETLREPREPKQKAYKYDSKYYQINYKNPNGLTIDEIVEQNPNGSSTVDACLYELNDALETFHFRWEVCFRQHTHHLSDDRYVSGLRQYIQQVADYLKSIKEQLPEITDGKTA